MKDDTISRRAALKGLEDLNIASWYELNEHSNEAYHEIKQMLETLPTVDAIPVVRCKNCKYSDGGTDEDGKLFLKCLGWVYGGTMEDDFCSHGERNERKDGDEHG